MLNTGFGTNKKTTMFFMLPSGEYSESHSEGGIHFLCQTRTPAVQSTVRLSDSLHSALVIRGVGNSTVAWEVEPQS